MCEVSTVLAGTPSYRFSAKDKKLDEFWDLLKQADSQDCIIVTASKQSTVSESVDESGIVRGHAFSILSVHEFDNQGQTEKLLQLRNPWGRQEWNGEWSDKSPLWTEELNAKLGHTDADDGTFFMPLNRFLEKYDDTHICANPDLNMYSHSRVMVDFNTSEMQNVQLFQFELKNDYEVNEKSFGFGFYQQGDVLGGQKRNPEKHVAPMIEILLIDPITGKLLFSTRSTYLFNNPAIIKEKTTLSAGTYTVLMQVLWNENNETSQINPEDFKRYVVDMYFPNDAEFGALQLAE